MILIRAINLFILPKTSRPVNFLVARYDRTTAKFEHWCSKACNLAVDNFAFSYYETTQMFSLCCNREVDTKTIILFVLIAYEAIIAKSALRASLAIYHLISNEDE